MSERPNSPAATDIAMAANDWVTGLGIITIAIFPLAIPLLALTALAAALLLVAGPFRCLWERQCRSLPLPVRTLLSVFGSP